MIDNDNRHNNLSSNVDYSDHYKFRDYVEGKKEKGVPIDSLKSHIRKDHADRKLGVVEPALFNIIDTVYRGKIDPEALDKGASEGTRRQPKDNQGTALWGHLKENGKFISDRTGNGFFAIGGILYPLNGESFSDYLSSLFYEETGTIPGRDAINQARSMAGFEARKNELNIGVRVARNGDKIIYDPIESDGSVFEITGAGINRIVPEIPFTARFKGMQDAKIEAGTLSDLLSLLELWNFTENQKVLIAGYIGAAFIPDIPHAILVIIGPHGAGKSSLTSAIKTIVDPNVLARQSLKKDDRDIAIAALHSWVIPFDNVNSVMPQYVSDALCRLTTGEGFRTRQLYTDSDEVILSLKRIIIINAINEPNYAPDFLDRALTLSLRAIVSSRKTELQIENLITRLSPRIRGYMLKIIPSAIAMYQNTAKEYEGKLPRMADFVIWAESMCRAMAFPEVGFFAAFKDAQEQEIRVTAQNDTVIVAIEGLMSGREQWRGKMQELLNQLIVMVGEGNRKQLPTDYRKLGRKLKELEPTLRALGFEIRDVYDAEIDPKHPVKEITKIPDPKHGESDTGNPGKLGDLTKYRLGNHPESTPMKNDKDSIGELSDPLKSDVQSDTTDTPIKNRMLGVDAKNSSQEYASVETVLKALKDWNFEVMEYDNVMYSSGTWKAKLKGRLDSYTKEQQDFLNGFIVKFAGSINADFTWIHFNVRSRP